jgi:polyphenol oxidase
VERRQTAGDVHVLIAPGLERRGVLAAFTERGGGVSGPPFRSLNLGFRTGDDPARVRRNRRRAAEALNVPHLTVARQVHGVRAIRIGPGRAGRGFLDQSGALPPADVLVTRRDRVALATLVADCLPVVMASDELVVTVHAGWRGLAAGVLNRAAGLFPDRKGAAAAVGPAIGPCHYEVGAEVADAVAGGSPSGAVRASRRGRTFLDLPGTAARVLRDAGVGQVEVAEECTACEPDRFFSHRRDGRTGRQAAVAMRM